MNDYFKDNVKLSFASRLSIIIVTTDDRVYEFKRSDSNHNKNTLLAISNDKSYAASLIEKSIIKELCYKEVIDFKNSWFHTIARTLDGKVYSWGWNRYGLLGNGINGNEITESELNHYISDKHIIDICCGYCHSLALTTDGDVYAWGYNEEGQVGNGKSCIGNGKNGNYECQLIPYHVKKFNGEKVKAIACGFRHSMALTENGNVYSWGDNRYGQLGIGIQGICSSPRKIKIHGVIIDKISCGEVHSLLLSHDGDIYVFGSNRGKSKYEKKIITPEKLIQSNKFIDIASYYDHNISVAFSETGLYFIWGIYCQQVMTEPRETNFDSFNDVFENFYQITYKPIKGRVISLADNSMRNKRYVFYFEEIEKLGEGNYGQVFKVRDKVNDQVHVIKKIKLIPNKAKSFMKELETCPAIKSFHFKNIIQYKDLWLENHSIYNINYMLYIQMELCDKTLKHIMKEMNKDSSLRRNNCLTPLGYYISSEMFIEILEGVQYLHKHNIIHKSLKPENIMLKIESNGRVGVKIADFYLIAIHEYAKPVVSQTMNNEIECREQSYTSNAETTNYSAPENLNEKNYHTKSDIFSLGIIFRELFNIDIKWFDESSKETNVIHLAKSTKYRLYENHENKSLLLMSKYRNAIELFKRMTQKHNYSQRPDCEKILNEKYFWALRKAEELGEEKFDANQELKKALNIKTSLSIVDKHSKTEEKSEGPLVYTYLRSKLLQSSVELESKVKEDRGIVGFARGLKPRKVIGAIETDGQLFYTIQWMGSSDTDLVSSEVASTNCPELVIEFLQSKLTSISNDSL